MKLSVVIPCYNEEEVLPYTYKRLYDTLTTLIKSKVIDDYEIIFINDASTDGTENIIRSLTKGNAKT